MMAGRSPDERSILTRLEVVEHYGKRTIVIADPRRQQVARDMMRRGLVTLEDGVGREAGLLLVRRR